MTPIVSELRSVGIVRLTAADVGLDAEACAIVAAHARTAADRPLVPGARVKKSFLRKLETPPAIASALAAMGSAVESVAQAYLGRGSLYRTDLYRTEPSDGPRRRSQMWHRDLEADRIFKMFLYLSDVTDTCGPLEYITGTSLGRRRDLGPVASYADDQDVCDADPRRQTCVGPAGTVWLLDSGGMHRGGFSTGGTRFHAMWTWLPS